jgi:methyltransferase (TIGR00027 family)
LGVQRMTDTMAARTRYFDAFFTGAATAGIRQAVILASGLDARGYRLRWPAGMTVYEIDQPEVLEFKTATLGTLGAQQTAELQMVPVDLRNDWPTALRDAGFDTIRPTVWSAEGLLPFLPPDAQDRLLDTVTSLSADGSRLATETFMDTAHLDPVGAEDMWRGISRQWRVHGADVELWDLLYQGERNEVGSYLESRGWNSVGTTMAQLLVDNGLPALPQSEKASFANNRYYTSIKRG